MEPLAKRLRYTPNVQEALVDAGHTLSELAADNHVDADAHSKLNAALERVCEANSVQKKQIATETALRLASECSSALGIMLTGDADVRVDLFSNTFVRKLVQRRYEKDDGKLDEEWVEEFLAFHIDKGGNSGGTRANEVISIICSLLESQGGVDLVPSLLAFLSKHDIVFMKMCDDSAFDKQQCHDAAYTLTELDIRLTDWVAPVTNTSPRVFSLRRSVCAQTEL